MKKLWYSNGAKAVSALIQGLFAGLLVLCLLAVRDWAAGDFGLSDTSRSFDRTDLFFRTTEEIIREKIDYTRNRELFERNGGYDELKAIDLQQYTAGVHDEGTLNVNTAYYIRDLLSFAENGSAAMGAAMRQALQGGATEEDAGAALQAQSQELETVLPISGSPLADYARLSSDPLRTLLEYYRQLCEVADDVAIRYHQYLSSSSDSSASPEAPSNVQYYIENTATGQRYTNMGAGSVNGALVTAQEDPTLTILFEGERKYNIMVANPECEFNEEATEWFMKVRFVSSGEKVLVAVDRSFPVGDRLQRAYYGIREQRPYILAALVLIAVCVLLIPFLLILSCIMTGCSMPGDRPSLTSFDEIPTEIAGGLCLILAISWWIAGSRLGGGWQVSRLHALFLILYIAVEYWIVFYALTSFVRRSRNRTLWSNSVCCAVALGTRAVYSARKRSQRLLLGYSSMIMLNVIFLLMGGAPGIVMFVVLNMAILLYLMRDAVGNQSVREGLQQISRGKLDYRINTQVLTGESREMGEAVNEMGEGLEDAVEDMLKNERLRAELITNVSHDLKTPLTSIMNYVDLLKREKLQNERAAGYVEILDQKTRRLRQLTEDLIEVSRISSGNVELHPMKLQLKQLLYQATGEFEERFEEKQVQLKLDFPGTPVYVTADGKQLWRVFENLLGNIAKYAKEGTQADISLTMEDDFAKIRFQNISSRPITATAQELKERFSRGDASRSEEGSGLGLSIAESLTQLMGGTFDVIVTEDTFTAEVVFPAASS